VPAIYLALGLTHSGLRKWQLARQNFVQGLEAARDDVQYIARFNNELGRLLLREIDRPTVEDRAGLTQARQHAQSALRISEEILRDQAGVAKASLLIAQVQLRLSRVVTRSERDEVLKDARASADRAYRADKRVKSGRVTLAEDLLTRGQIVREQGQPDKALKDIEESHKMRMEAYGPDDPILAHTFNELGGVYYESGIRERGSKQRKKYRDAKRNFDRAAAIWEREFGPYYLPLASAKHNVSSLLLEQGEYGAALTYAKAALEAKEIANGRDDKSTAETHNLLGLILFRQVESGDLNSEHRFQVLQEAKRHFTMAKERAGTAEDREDYQKGLDAVMQLLDQ